MQTIGKRTTAGRRPMSGVQIMETAVPATSEILEIVDSEYLEDYRLKLKFGDGCEQEIDFRPFLTEAQHPAIRRYLDTEMFRSYTLRHGNIDWNDYDMAFPLADLYRGEI